MVAGRSQPKQPAAELAHGIPFFLDQIIKILTAEQRSNRSRIVSTKHGLGINLDVAPMATLHGRDLHDQGFTIGQVIRDYGDFCQAVTHLAAAWTTR